MKRSKRNAAFVWMLIAYLAMGVIFWWSANQPPHDLATSVFFMTLLLSWVPLYVYANRRDMACNKVFWLSRAAGLTAGVLMFFLLWYFVGNEDPSSGESSNEWMSWLGGVATYFIGSWIIHSLIKWSATGTQKAVEQHLENQNK